MGGTVKPLRVGVVGAGNISRAYLGTLPTLSNVEVTAVADLVTDRAEAAAATVDGARALPVDGLLAADDVDLVLNLTIPAAHAEVAHAAIASGKHVYGEKPLAASTGAARSVLDAAALAAGTAHRADGQLAYHVLDVMECLLAAAESGHAVDVASSCERPAAVPLGARPDRGGS
jgi:predicted dehydrogenase